MKPVMLSRIVVATVNSRVLVSDRQKTGSRSACSKLAHAHEGPVTDAEAGPLQEGDAGHRDDRQHQEGRRRWRRGQRRRRAPASRGRAMRVGCRAAPARATRNASTGVSRSAATDRSGRGVGRGPDRACCGYWAPAATMASMTVLPGAPSMMPCIALSSSA